MKKVIDGKTYNTETATKIDYSDNGLSASDFHNWDETLYKTQKGRFFLKYRGGGLSRWAVSVGNNGRTGSEGLAALTGAEALAWCERNQVDADLIAQHFELEEA